MSFIDDSNLIPRMVLAEFVIILIYVLLGIFLPVLMFILAGWFLKRGTVKSGLKSVRIK
jgi:hypothetical protein